MIRFDRTSRLLATVCVAAALASGCHRQEPAEKGKKTMDAAVSTFASEEQAWRDKRLDHVIGGAQWDRHATLV